MRFYTQISRPSLQALPKAMREPLERALDEILPTLQTAFRATILASVQRVGARAVDEAVDKLGLGRFGIRLTSASMMPSAESWEAMVLGWTPSCVAEAAELLIRRGLDSFFDLGAGEWFGIESMNIHWRTRLRDSTGVSEISEGGSVVLNWGWLEREDFRRRVLENLESGASQSLTLTGFDASGLVVVEVDLVLRAKARAQIHAKNCSKKV